MKDTAKCFIKTINGYVEISYSELLRRCKTIPSYKDRLFIPIQGMLLEVSEKEYKNFYRDKRRQKYQREEAIRANEVSYHALDTDESSGEEQLKDETVDVEQMACDRVMQTKLRKTLDTLDETERSLIQVLYFEKKSEREVAAMLGISQPAVHKRRNKILQKIKIQIK